MILVLHSFSEKKNKEENTPSISSSAEAAENKPVKYVPAWEQYVDSLEQNTY